MTVNLERLARVARRAEPLLDRLVFVGGAITELYFSDPASGRVRPTTDADAVIEAATYVAYRRISAELQELGFRQSADQNDPIYRWRADGDVLDVMPIDPDVLGFSNPWYAEGVQRSVTYWLSDDLGIRIFPPPLVLASKLAAYADRGRDDPYLSQDLEDVVALLVNRPELVDEVEAEPEATRHWIAEQLNDAFGTEDARAILQGFLPEVTRTPGLMEMVETRIRRLAGPPPLRNGD